MKFDFTKISNAILIIINLTGFFDFVAHDFCSAIILDVRQPIKIIKGGTSVIIF